MARTAEKDHNYMRKQLIQMDLLKVGERHLVRLDEQVKLRTRPKECMMEVLGCYPDYYLMVDEAGRKYSLLKSDLYCGVWGVQGLDPKTKLIKIAEEIQGPEPEGEKMNAKEELEMLREERVKRCKNWLINNPLEGLDVKTLFPDEDLSYYKVNKLIDEIILSMKQEGKKVTVQNTKPKTILYTPWDIRVEEESEEVKEPEEVEEVEPVEEPTMEEDEPEEIKSKVQELKKFRGNPTVTDREFLENKKKSLTWQIEYNQEMWEMKKIEHEVRQEMMKTMLNEINSHLNSQGGPQ